MGYKFSINNPLKGLKDVKAPISSDSFEMYKNKYGKPLKLKQATFYLASRTGINVPGVSDKENALFISDCLGRQTHFKYSIQNSMIELIDKDGKLGLLNAVKAGKEVPAFNWIPFTTDSLLLGYILNMFDNMRTTPDWTQETVLKYATFNHLFTSGQAFGVFLPEYLATDGYDRYVRHSLLASQYTLGIGSLLIYENENAKVPLYFIPDVDFITQFDLTKFMGLGLGQLYTQYNNEVLTNEKFREENRRCDCPKPSDITLIAKKTVTVKQKNSGLDNVKIIDSMNSDDTNSKQLVERLHSLRLLLSKKLNDFSDNPYILHKSSVDEGIGDVIVLHMTLERNSLPYLSRFNPNIKLKLPKNDAINKQYLVLNVTFKLINIDVISYTTSIGLYGTDNMGVECYSSQIDYKSLSQQLLDDLGFIKLLVGDEFFSKFNDLSVGFRESLFKGLESGMVKLKTALLLKTNESSLKVKEELCDEDKYELIFVDDSVLNSLTVKMDSKTGFNSYHFKLDVGKLGYTPSELSCDYVGDENMKAVIESMCEGIISNLA